MSYKLHIEEEGTCLECGTAISGRRDKRFCSLSCKNKHKNIAPINKGKFPGPLDKKIADL